MRGFSLTCFDELKQSFLTSVSTNSGLCGVTQDVSDALSSDAFRNQLVFEPIYGIDDILAYEALARPKNAERSFSPQKISDELYLAGQHEAFDLFTLAHVLGNSRNQTTVTVNISPKSLLSPSFCEKVIEKLSEYDRDPRSIIIEVLEHDVDPNADASHLSKMEDLGVRFALDDFGHEQSHFNRLSVFQRHLSMIKIDGSLIENLSDADLKYTCSVLKQAVPGVLLVAEHVQDFEQASRLFSLGFDGVQGNRLQAIETKYIAKIYGRQGVDLDIF